MRANFRVRTLSFAVAGCLTLLLTSGQAHAQLTSVDWTASSYGDESCCSECDDACSYGPCDCNPRMTLFQWSYGTSFGGGADLDEPLVTDRPDFTESSSTVGRGVNQLEMGYTYTHDEAGTTSTQSQSYPEFLWRAGILAEWLEFSSGMDVRRRPGQYGRHRNASKRQPGHLCRL